MRRFRYIGLNSTWAADYDGGDDFYGIQKGALVRGVLVGGARWLVVR